MISSVKQLKLFAQLNKLVTKDIIWTFQKIRDVTEIGIDVETVTVLYEVMSRFLLFND